MGEITQTDFGYTFQRGLPGTGLMDYRARFYAPALGRFIQPDSIVPGTENPQAWNRYSYVLNSPLDYIDPTGHDPHWCEDDASCRTDYLNSMMALWRSAHHGGSGGGGGNGKDDPRENNYYVRSDPTLYLLGWENFETAWSIWTNSDFNYWQRFGAGAYMGAWGGAHGMFTVGVTILAWEAVIVTGTQIATKNPDAANVMIGRYYNSTLNYMIKAGDRFTYFTLGRAYNLLDKVGLAKPMNQRFITNQIEKSKDFFVYGVPEKITNLYWEVAMIWDSGKYTEIGNLAEYWGIFIH